VPVICRCLLSGRAHYARRCPVCSLHRDPGWVRSWHADPQEARISRRQAAEALRRRAQEILARISELCTRPAPAWPVATPPRREMSWRERRAWSYRASGWEAARLHEIQESLHKPLRLLRALESLPAPARYVRAGRRLVGEYTRRMEAAGWQL